MRTKRFSAALVFCCLAIIPLRAAELRWTYVENAVAYTEIWLPEPIMRLGCRF